MVHHGSGSFAGTGAQGGKPRPIFVLKRGDVRQPAEEVGPGTVPISRELQSRFELPADATESARRVALARWITDERNPLTWRVIVNRVWHYHFGRGLADSPNDFGRMGQPPTNPALLDWLAVEFRDGGQSLKALHRLIVTSATYRQSSFNSQLSTLNFPDSDGERGRPRPQPVAPRRWHRTSISRANQRARPAKMRPARRRTLRARRPRSPFHTGSARGFHRSRRAAIIQVHTRPDL